MNIALLLFACCFSAATIAAEKKTLTVVSPWKLKSLDLGKSGYIFTRMGCLEMLTTADANGNLVGFLAESWAVHPDRLTWTFTLRPNIKFHDNTPLTARAVANSLNISLKNKGVLTQAKIAKITAVDTLSLQIRTTEPFSSLPAYLAHYSAGIVSEASYDENEKSKKIFGTGQYILTDIQGKSLLRFKANHDYWGEKPRIEFTEYQAVPKGETRGFMMKAGQADMVFTLSPSDAEQLQASDAAKVETIIIPRTRLLLLNCNLPIFSDVRVRQALSMAIDRQGIASGLLRNPASAATQLLPSAVSMWYVPKLKPLEYNLEKARKMFADAGWKPGADGILEKEGQRFEFELTTYASRPMLPPIAAALQQQLKKVGVKIEISVGESSQIPDKRADGSLQAALLARNFSLIPDAIGTIFGDFGPTPGSWGAMGWQSDKLNKLLADYLGAFDTRKATELRMKIISILQTELPVIPVTWYEHIVAVSNRVEGVVIDPFEIKSYTKGAQWVEYE
jgi:peptide/nickel transport system substrate-binding protein